MKKDPNFFKVWGGISGVQHTLPLLLTEAQSRRALSLPLLAQLTSFNVAARFRLSFAKGHLTAGADADLALVDVKRSCTVSTGDLFYRHPQTPYAGSTLTGKVLRSILRGQTVIPDGKVDLKPIG